MELLKEDMKHIEVSNVIWFSCVVILAFAVSILLIPHFRTEEGLYMSTVLIAMLEDQILTMETKPKNEKNESN